MHELKKVDDKYKERIAFKTEQFLILQAQYNTKQKKVIEARENMCEIDHEKEGLQGENGIFIDADGNERMCHHYNVLIDPIT